MNTIALILFTNLIGFLIILLIKSMRRPSQYPPGPGFLPIVGNTLQLRKAAIAFGGTHNVLEKWSKKYNSNLIGLKLGGENVVAVLSQPLVREIHTKEVFEGRPDNFFLRLRTMGTRRGITTNDGPLYYEQRNFAMKVMRNVGYGRTQMEQHIEKETECLLKFIENTNSADIWPGTFLAPSVLNVLWSLVANKRFERDDLQLRRLLDLMNRRSKVFDISGGILAQYSWLRFIAPNKTGYNLIRQLNAELYDFFMETIEDHKARLLEEKRNGNGKSNLGDSDYIFAYLEEMEKRSNAPIAHPTNETFTEIELMMTILDFFIAGSQTTSNTIDLALMVLAMRTDIQEKLFMEINENLNVSEFPQLSSRILVPYVDAYIMEVQRYYHVAPVTGPRRTLYDTQLLDYRIPKNTTILISLRSVHMDKNHFGDPEIFRPERFIDSEGKVIKDEYFMPFGQGKRRCLGDNLARACIFSFVVKIIQNYRIECGETDLPSSELLPGITLSPQPYKIRFIPRNGTKRN